MKNVFALLFCFAAFANLFGGAFPSAAENASARLAIEARERAPWTMPDEIFRNYVLPDTSVGEARDDWRPLFREKFLPLVRECTTPTAAAETLNREIWKILGVRYSPERDRPDQSPFHSMRIGKASCSGLSILLIDACRAVGVPARFVGCRWKNKPGNHSWVEIWDAGQWHHLGAGDGGNVDSAWFDADAAAATPDDPRFAIYAACAEPTGLSFPLAWIPDGEDSGVPALNVTARYLCFAEKIPAGTVRIGFSLRSRDGARIAREILVFDAETRREIARGKTKDERFDLNDHLAFPLRPGTKIFVAFASEPSRILAKIDVPAAETIFALAEN